MSCSMVSHDFCEHGDDKVGRLAKMMVDDRDCVSDSCRESYKQCVAEAVADYVMTFWKEARSSDWSDDATAALFWGESAPEITVKDYVLRIAKYSGCSASALVVACVLLRRLVGGLVRTAQGDFSVNAFTAHRLVLTCCVVATKVQDDVMEDFSARLPKSPRDPNYSPPPVSNGEWAVVGGVSIVEVNRLELALLSVLDFRASVGAAEFMEMLDELSRSSTSPIHDAAFRDGADL